MNGHLAWLLFADIPGTVGAGSDGVCPEVCPQKGMAMREELNNEEPTRITIEAIPLTDEQRAQIVQTAFYEARIRAIVREELRSWEQSFASRIRCTSGARL